jgi:hypothetical protein
MKRAPESKPPSTASKLLPAQMELRKATDAIRSALKGLEAGGHLELNKVSAAFVQVQRVIHARTQRDAARSSDCAPGEAVMLAEFCAALAEWDRQLPRLHGWLLAERARLIARQSHAGSVQTWIETTGRHAEVSQS